jgi:hypothetical protein
MNALGGDSFDQWLGQQLQQHVATHNAPSPMPAQAQYHAAYIQAGVHVPVLAKVAAVLTTKAAIAVTFGVLAAAAAGEAVVTGSINPVDWGQQVVQQVQKCKDALAPESHGIGDCVSSFASQHGKNVSDEHRAHPTPGQGNGNGTGNGSGDGKDNTHPTPPAHPSPPDKDHPSPPSTGHSP